jgi:iron(III) transport system permease protein
MRKGSAVTGRSLTIWLVAAAISVLCLPWYGVEGGIFSADFIGKLFNGAADAWPVWARGLLDGKIWLLPLLAVPAISVAAARAKPRQPLLLALAGGLGIAWTLLEGFGIGGKGWGYGFLTALFGQGPGQPSLGWGAMLFVLSSWMIAAHGLAWMGWCRGNVFTVGAIGTVLGAILIFVFYPVLCILLSAFRDNAGHTDLGLFFTKFTDESIWGLGCLTANRSCGVAWNSLSVAIIVGVLTTLLGLAFALISARTRFPAKPLLRLLSVLPVITPPFVIGLSLKILFGRAGMITLWLSAWFGLPRVRWIEGMPGLRR